MALDAILQFNHLDLEFKIPKINTKLSELFVLATTKTRKLDDLEHIQHTLNVCAKTFQPESWAQWVRNSIDIFEEGGHKVSQNFMNLATMKYNKIINAQNGEFKGSVHFVQEVIMALFATKKKQRRKRDDVKDDGSKKAPKIVPPFLTHSKNYSTNLSYKVGDKKVYQRRTYYFCDAPTHREKAKWHIHTTSDCWVHQKWLKKEAKERQKRIMRNYIRVKLTAIKKRRTSKTKKLRHRISMGC